MSNKYLWGRTKRLWYLGLLLVASLFSQNAWAQVSAYSFSSSSGTYSPISGGTVLNSPTRTFDGTAYNALPIGFSFVYNGTTYTTFSVNPNGYITMGSTAGTTEGNAPGTSTNSIFALNRDLSSGYAAGGTRASGSPNITAMANNSGAAVGMYLSTAVGGLPVGTTISAVGTNQITMSANATSANTTSVYEFNFNGDATQNPSEIRYETIGTSGSQTLVVQFTRVKRYGTTKATVDGDAFSFQIRLNEGTNTVQIVYGDMFTGATTTTNNIFGVGLTGAAVSDFNLRTTTTDWSATTAAAANGTTSASKCTLSPTVKPASGLTYTWTAPNCLAPSAIVVSLTGTTSANFSWTAPSSVPSVGYEYFVSTSSTTPSTAANTGTATATTTGSASSLTPSTTYYVFVRSECTTDTEYSTWTTATSFFTGYCTPAPSSVDGTGITNVTFSGVNNTTSSEAGNYGNYTSLTGGSVPAGTSATVTITYSTGGADYNTRIWVDWNNDLDFTDSGEEVYAGTSSTSSPAVLAASFTVPALTTVGNYRMRIGGADLTTPTPCYTGTWACYEDYTLEVTAAPSCLAPTAPSVASITNSTATVSWIASISSPTNGYDLYVSTTNTAPTGSESYTDVTGVSQGLSALTGSTTYYWWVRSDCGGSTYSSWLTGGSFTTECDPTVAFPASEPFASYLPSTCWKEGLNGDLTAGPASIGGDGVSTWSADGFLNSGSTGATKVNMYSTNRNQWLISPQFTIPASPSHRMTYDVGATDWGATSAVADWEADDFVEVLISTSGMTNWTVIETYNASNVPSSAGQGETVDLTAYAGQTVRFAFRAVEGATSVSADLDFFIDNVVVEETPSCLIPTGLSSVGATTSTIDFQWTASASDPSNGYEWEVRTSGAAGSGATGLADSGSEGYGITAASADGLSANTTYSIYVRANCGAGGYSAWTTALTVFTGYCTPAPTSVDDEGITNVTFSGVNNTTSTESGNYGDYTALTGGSFAASTLATVNITYTTGTTYDTKIWVDWNNDLDFTDSGEEVYTGTSTSASPTTLVATFTIPAPTTVGSYRMRIGGLDFGPATPCYTGSWGTYEDYTLEVTAAPSCLAPTAPVSGSLTTVGATVSWTASTSSPANGYDLYVSTTNTAPTGSESYIDVTGVSQVLNTLSSNTTYYWWVRSDCGAGDYSPWLTGGSFTTLCAASSVPYLENFESAPVGSYPACSFVLNVNGDGATWTARNAPGNGFTTRALRYNYSSVNNANDWWFTGAISLVGGTSYTISYDYGDNGFTESMTVRYGSAASVVGMTNLLADHPTIATEALQSNSLQFTPATSGDYYFGFHANSIADQFYLFLDNVSIIETPACVAPTALNVSSIAATTATLSWTASTSDPSNGYEWEVRTSGAAGSGATGLAASGSVGYGVVTANATGLTASTAYSVYVRGNCGSSFSAWTSAVTFTTACAPVSLPFTETFNPASTSLECWTTNDANGDAYIDLTWGYYDYFWVLTDGTGANDDYVSIYTNTDNDDYLISPALPLTGNEWVTFDFLSSSATTPAGFEVLLSTTGTDPGDFTTTVLSLTNPTNTDWDNMYIDLSAYTGTVYLAWHIPGGVESFETIGIDNVTVELMPACLPATNVGISGYATNWTASWSDASDVVIEYGPVGFTPGTGGTAGVGGTIVSGSGSSTAFVVPANATYDAYVRANCTATADGYSTNSGPYSFNSYTVVPFSGSQTITTCNTTIYDHAGPSVNYSNNADGTLVIYPGTPGSVLSFVGTFAAEGGIDDLIFYRGVGTSGSVLASYNTVSSDTPININLLSDQLDQPVTVRFDSDNSVVRAGFTLNVTCASACGLVTSFPAPTSTLASVCPGESFTLSFPTVPAAIGYTYQWYSSTGNGAPYVAISGQTGPTLTTTQTAQTVYACNIACAYGNNYTSAGRTVPMNAPTACYPVSAATNTGDTDISNVAVNGSNAAVTNTCGTGTYTNYTGTSVFNLGRGSQATLAVTSCDPGGTAYSGDCGVFIDFNQDGDFVDAGESVYQAPGILTPVAGSALFSGNFTIPATATLGATRMRVVVQEQTSNVTISATGTYPYGETEDYTVTIVPGVANDLFANAVTPTQNIYPSCSNMTGTLVGATDATAGVIGDDVWYKFVAQGTAYRVSTAGAAGDVTLELHNSSNVQITANVWTAGSTNSTEMLVASGLTVGNTYYVRVINQSATPSNFTICLQRFSGSGCDYGPNYSNLCSNFKATWCGASSYTVDFFDGANAYTRTSTGTTLFTLSTVVPDPTATNVLVGGLRYGTTYTTTVEANYIITDYSNNVLTTLTVPGSSPCSVIMGTQPDVALRSTDRSSGIGVNARALNSFVAADPFLCNLAEYLWEVVEVDPNNPSTTISPVPVIIESNSSSRFLRLSASTNAIFHSGGRYRIRIAPKFFDGAGTLPTDDYIGTYGSQYDVLIAGVAPSSSTMENPGTEVVLVDKINEGGVFASLYPNPNTGESVNLNIAGIESESVNISIMDASGRVVWSNRYVVDGALFTTVNFDRPLAAGMYMVEMVYNGQVMTQRMMVQK